MKKKLSVSVTMKKYDDDLQDFEENPYTGLLEEVGGGVGVGGGGRGLGGEGPYELGMDTLVL